MPEQLLTDEETAEEAWTSVDVRQAIRRQADIVALAIDAFVPRVEAVLDAVQYDTLDRVYLTGCGDSYYAAMAAKLAFERWTGLPTEVLPSMEFSRYAVGDRGRALVGLRASRTPAGCRGRSRLRRRPRSAARP